MMGSWLTQLIDWQLAMLGLMFCSLIRCALTGAGERADNLSALGVDVDWMIGDCYSFDRHQAFMSS